MGRARAIYGSYGWSERKSSSAVLIEQLQQASKRLMTSVAVSATCIAFISSMLVSVLILSVQARRQIGGRLVEIAPDEFIYIWTPRSTDIPAQPNTSEARVLEFLLAHCSGSQYTIKRGDSVDQILRTQLFVAQGQYRHAYELYVNELKRRNPQVKDLNQLVAGESLIIPDGPGFAAVGNSGEPLAIYQAQIEQSLAKGNRLNAIRLNQVLSKKLKVFTHFENRRPRSQTTRKGNAAGATAGNGTYVPQSQKISKGSSGRKSAGTSAYLSPSQRTPKGGSRGTTAGTGTDVTSSNSALEKLVAEDLERRRVVPAINTSTVHRPTYVNRQVLILKHVELSEVPAEIRSRAYPAFLPASNDATADCSKGCRKCLDILVSPTVQLADTAVLVADTGLSQLRSPVISPPVFRTYDDLADNWHGTFVYSEIASTEFGPLSPSNMFISKVVRTATPKDTDAQHGYVYDMQKLLTALIAFANKRTFAKGKSRVIFPTWIANISASGKAKSTRDSFLLQDPSHGILYVAAAGNDYGSDITNEILFAEENDPRRDLLIVGALDAEQRTKADYSNYNPNKVDVFAPGTCVCGLGRPSVGNAGQLNGTSQAAPIVSTAAALLAAAHPGWQPLQIKWRLISTSAFIEEFDGYSAGGVVDLNEAMKTNFRVKTRLPQTLDVMALGFSREQERPWNTLLGPIIEDNSARNVLRLHQLSKCDIAEAVCFKRYIMGKLPDKKAISASSELSLVVDGKTSILKASEIIDIFLTVDQTLADDKAWLYPRP